MLHLRVICPAGRTDEAVGLLLAEPGATNLVVLPGAARQPAGDALRQSARALLVGFPVGMAVTFLAAVLGRVTGAISPASLDKQGALTAFISRPDGFSLLVAVLAGAAGILSLTSAKSGALIGVLISVTTVPAAGNAAVALALGHLSTAGGAALQLAINLVGIVVGGLAVLLVQARRAADRDSATV